LWSPASSIFKMCFFKIKCVALLRNYVAIAISESSVSRGQQSSLHYLCWNKNLARHPWGYEVKVA
jgi:hypothetical protein